MAIKECSKCKKPVPAVAFYKDHRNSDGLASACCKCYKAAAKAWDAANPGKRRARAKRRRLKDPECSWRWTLLKRYGLVPADYWQLYAAQDGKCGICGQAETMIRQGTLSKLSVDHNHATGEIRGLLCNRCNRAIGRMDDDPAMLRASVAWVETAKTARFVPT